MTNPNQEPAPDSLSVPQALRLIAERTAFRTEEETTMVLAAIDKAIAADEDQGDSEPDDEHAPDGGNAPDVPPAKSTPRKAAAK